MGLRAEIPKSGLGMKKAATKNLFSILALIILLTPLHDSTDKAEKTRGCIIIAKRV